MERGQAVVYGGELNSDIDYGDVFGGPPKRSSMNVLRHSFAETVASNASTEEDEEKPVFGHEASNRQRHTSDDFYDDIFRGDGIYSSSPRRSDRNPQHLIPSTADPFACSYPQFSLPSAKLTKLESSSVASGSRSSNTESTGSSSSPWRSSSDLQKQDEIRSRARPAYRPSLLSHGKEELPDPIRSPLLGDEAKSKENSSMFHFSLYKWAGKGSPLLVSLRGATNGSKLPWITKSKDDDNKQIDKDSSSASTSSTNIVADEGKQTRESSSKTITEESDTNLQQKAQKPSQPKNSMSLQSFLDESDNIAMNEAEGGRFEGKNRQKDGGERTKTESSGENVIRNAVKGKIKGFAKIFDSSKSQNNIQLRSQSLRWDRSPNSPKSQTDNAAKTPGAEKQDGKLQWTNINKAKIQPDSSKLDNKNVSKEQKTDSEKIPPSTTSQSSSSQTEEKKKPPESVKTQEDFDDILGDYFQVKELFDDDDKVLENAEKVEDNNNQDLDFKIRKWAQGKEGNIRSLLSTLQLVLWPNSGWKPVALVDIIEGNAVKRAYQKTLLYLHPDKLQQRGAPPDHHYIARKVFDLLQEAWDHFNTTSQI